MYFSNLITIPLAILASAAAAPTGQHDYQHSKNTTKQRHPRWDNQNSLYYTIPCPHSFTKRYVSSEKSHLERRDQIGGVFVCDGAGWTGICPYEVLPLGQCFGVTPKLDWDSKIAAVGPDPGFNCTLFSGANGGGNTLHIAWPGIADLSVVGWGPGTYNEVMGITCYMGPVQGFNETNIALTNGTICS